MPATAYSQAFPPCAQKKKYPNLELRAANCDSPLSSLPRRQLNRTIRISTGGTKARLLIRPATAPASTHLHHPPTPARDTARYVPLCLRDCRRTEGSAKCESIDRPSLQKLKVYYPRPPTPVTRRFVAPDVEYLYRDPANPPVRVIS